MKITLASQVLAACMNAFRPVLLKGAPGVGKTDIVAQACTLLGYDLILSHPVVSDPTEAKGLPWPDKEANAAKFLPFGDLHRALSATRPTVWFLDDLGQATPAVQASFMQLILARRINDHVLPDCVTFVAATNRKQDRAGVNGLLEPVKSRFTTIIEVEPDLDSWCIWAYQNGIPSDLIAFMRLRGGGDQSGNTPGLLHQFAPTTDLVNSPSPRTWANVGRLMQMDLPAEAMAETYGGAVGPGAASELLAFLEVLKDLPNPDAVMLNPEAATIPEKPSVLYALASALIYRVNDQNFGRFHRYASRLHDAGHGEFAALMMRDAVNVAPEVQQTPDFIRYTVSPMGQAHANS